MVCVTLHPLCINRSGRHAVQDKPRRQGPYTLLFARFGLHSKPGPLYVQQASWMAHAGSVPTPDICSQPCSAHGKVELLRCPLLLSTDSMANLQQGPRRVLCTRVCFLPKFLVSSSAKRLPACVVEPIPHWCKMASVTRSTSLQVLADSSLRSSGPLNCSAHRIAVQQNVSCLATGIQRQSQSLQVGREGLGKSTRSAAPPVRARQRKCCSARCSARAAAGSEAGTVLREVLSRSGRCAPTLVLLHADLQ